jgi:hypothetical protein
MHYSVLLIVLLLTGCATSSNMAASAIRTERKASVIFVGMSFRKAEEQLTLHGAKTVHERAVLIDISAGRKGRDLHFYILPNRVRVDLVSGPAKTERIVESIRVGTYDPKSWESLEDPEQVKFRDSFREKKEYDLEDQPTQAPEPMARAAVAHLERWAKKDDRDSQI